MPPDPDNLEKRLDATVAQVSEIDKRVGKIEESLPDKSTERHRIAHQEELERSAAKKAREDDAHKLRFETKKNLINAAIFGFISSVFGLCAFAANAYFNAMVHKAVDTPPARIEYAKPPTKEGEK